MALAVTSPPAARVLVVMPYWSFFESSTTTDLRHDRESLLSRVCDAVRAAGCDVAGSYLLDSSSSARPWQEQIVRNDVDVLLVAPSMAAPPAPVLDLIHGMPDVPLVIWPCGWPSTVLGEFSHSDIVERGATVGTPMITSVLVREGRPFRLLPVDCDVDGPGGQLADELTAARAAARVRAARIGRIGEALPGYASVEVDDEALSAHLGLNVIRIPPSEFAERFAAQSATATSERVLSLREEFVVDCPAASLTPAGRAVDALEGLTGDQRLSAGTLNCHVGEIRGSSQLGIAPCLALGQSTSHGRPWTCTGDILTAIGMLICSEVSGTSLYHEIEAFDPADASFIIANSGEHDTRMSAQTPRLAPSPWWPASICATHPIPEGPATIVALAPVPDGFRLICAEGSIEKAAEPATGTVSGRFRWSGTPGQGWGSWIEAGAGHHSSLGLGHHAGRLASVAKHLGIDFVAAS